MASASDVIAHYDHLAGGWDRRYAEGSFRRRAEFTRRIILPRLDLRGPWLDAGCGSGHFSRMLADAGAPVTGVDWSAGMVEAARLAAGEPHPGTTFCRVASLEDLPFPDGSFSGCLCLSVIEYACRPERCLEELARVLAPGGQLVISIPHRWSPVRAAQAFCRLAAGPSAFDYLSLSRFSATPRVARRTLAAAGFDVCGVEGFDPFLPDRLRLPPSLIYALATRRAEA